MGEPDKHINYSQEDIQRYLDGNMNAHEMHALERAALQDAFLADAIEGFADADAHTTRMHLNEIVAAFAKDQQQTPVVPISKKKTPVLRIAAIVFALMLTGFATWLILQNNKPVQDQSSIAKVETKNTAPQDTLAQQDESATDTTEKNTVQPSLQIASSSYKKSSKRITVNTDKETKDEYLSKDNIVSETAGIAVAPPVAMQDSSVVKQNNEFFKSAIKADQSAATAAGRNAEGYLSKNISTNIFYGKVVDDNNKPVADALVAAGLSRTTVTDTNGNFSIVWPDSVLNVTVSSVGFETTNANLSSQYSNQIKMGPSNQSLSEVVVTGYGIKKDKKLKDKSSDSSYPSGGWQSFQEYVYKKLNLPFDSLNNRIIAPYGYADIEFDIDDSGTPYNFNVIRSAGSDNDAKAIQAIKDGPKWITSKKNKKGKVTIHF